jgi:hypothetical protein
MLLYHLRLALLGLRRDRGLAVPALVGLALAASVWSTVAVIYLRVYGGGRAPAEGLHQVEVDHRDPAGGADPSLEPPAAVLSTRTRLSYPEYQLLASSGIPSAQTASFRSRVAVALPSAPAQLRIVRFVEGDFFALFHLPCGEGRFFSAEEAARGDAVAVLGGPLGRALARQQTRTAQTVLVEGRPFQVVGETAGDQPFRAEWDIAASSETRDEIYLPLSWARRLLARPYQAVWQSPVGPTFDDLLRSDAVFVSLWVALPTAEKRAAYAGYLDRVLGQRNVGYRLRSYRQWRTAFPFPATDVSFFALLTVFALLGAGFNMARLLLAKALVRREEMGIHRALGATRGALFRRELLGGLALALPAALAGQILALPYLAFYNQALSSGIIGAQLSLAGVLLSVMPPFLVGAAATVYPAWRASRASPTIHLGAR